MNGIIIEVVGGGTIWLLLVRTRRRIVNQAVDHRCMIHIVEGVGIASPHELVGRAVTLADDGLTIAFS